MLQGNPEFLVVRGSTRMDVLVFALIVVCAPPLIVVGVERLIALVSESLANVLHMVAVWAFGFLALLQVLTLFDPAAAWVLLLPLVAALFLSAAYLRLRPLRTFLSVSLALPLIGLLGFVFRVPLVVDDHPGVDVKVAHNTPIVLVVLDELPLSSLLRGDGTLDSVRYPNFARFASTATWYPRATTVHASTTQAVPAILTGLRPHAGELPTLGDHPDNLFTLLGERYAIRSGEQVTHLCPTRYCPEPDPAPVLDRQRGLLYDVTVGYLHRVLPSSLQAGLPPIGERWGGFGDSGVDARHLVLGALDNNAVNAIEDRARGETVQQFAQFVRSIRPQGRRPSLTFEHLILPHNPWQFLPSGQEYGSAATIDGIDESWISWTGSPVIVSQTLQRHLLQTQYADRLLGQFLDRIRKVGLFDRSLIVVTADHGASFYSNEDFRHPTPENFGDIAGVPLFVKYPGETEAHVDRRDSRSIDILPTIADVVGARIPWHVDGRSLRSAPRPGPVTVVGFDQLPVSSSFDAVERRVRATARRNASLFGSGSDSMFRLGPRKDLLGRATSALPTEASEGTSIALEEPAQFENVRPGSLFVPARIVGSIQHSPVDGGTPLAVAVNGRIAAVTESFDRPGADTFAVLVPAAVFRGGKNSVDVYAVEGSRGSTRLIHLGGNASSSSSSPSAVAAG
jgi:hypothetical protein